MASAPPVPSYVRTAAGDFLSSLSVDRPLARFDLAGSVAHVEALEAAGILSKAERATLTHGLRAIAREIDAGTFSWRADLEDVHTNVESRLTELVGPLGGKLQTGRSRNDQIAVDERLYLRATLASLTSRLLALEAALIDRAEEEAGTPLPGYTHLQRAQPVSLGHHLLAHFWRFDRDLDRLFDLAKRGDVSPLGAGALAGSTLGLDPHRTAVRLGFTSAFENSLDAVSDRDPLAELLFALALFAVHASGFAEEVVVFATKEFGFVDRTEAIGSGSSLMPQKRNPDVAELVRGRTGRAVGDLVALLTVLKGLPLAYDRDLQEDKASVLDAVATAEGTLDALTALVRGLRFHRARMAEAAGDPELYATDLAERLVVEGVPFREAHDRVRDALPTGNATGPRVRLSVPAAVASGPVEVSLEPSPSLARREQPGSPGPRAVAAQLGRARDRVAARRASLSSLVRKVELVEELLNEGTT